MLRMGGNLKSGSGFALLLFSLIASSGGYEYPVPERFLGLWAVSPESCVTEGANEALKIAPESIVVEESRGAVVSVRTGGTNNMVLYAEFSNERGPRVAAMKFVLSADGRELVEKRVRPEEDLVRFKCSVVGGE